MGSFDRPHADRQAGLIAAASKGEVSTRADYLARMPRLTLSSLLLVCCSFAFVGCGSDAPSASKVTAAPTTIAGPAVTSASSGDCGADAVAAVTAKETDAAVTKIDIIGGCSMVNITTSLANAGVSAALDICDRAAEVAYVGKVSSVSVESGAGKELAIGMKGSSCIGEP
jgi:hypothetical protein